MSAQLFISYTHQDVKFATKLARTLQDQGVSVWFDQWRLTGEEEWEQALRRGVQSCTHFVVILTPAAVNSWVVREQTVLASREGKPIIPLILDPCALPESLQNRDPIRLSLGFGPALARLLERVGQPSQAPSASVSPARNWQWLRALPLWFWVGTALLFLGGMGALWLGRESDAQPVSRPAGVTPVVVVVQQAASSATVEVVSIPNPYPTPLKTKIRPRDGKIMVGVPVGDFLMGSAEGDPLANEDEQPQRLVYLDQFWIDKTEVTNVQYRRCVEAGACSPSQARNRIFAAEQLPVVGVDWAQAGAYCAWAGARLPTEAEWEKAARGADGRRYPWGDQFEGARLNYCDENCVADWRDQSADDGHRYTAPPGSYPQGASPYGALDMAGNVWEWTADWYDPEAYSNQPYRNPTGPESGRQRVIRGGSWLYPSQSVRAARRHRDTPTSSYENIGFRCAMSDS